jgi:hypothetical protein
METAEELDLIWGTGRRYAPQSDPIDDRQSMDLLPVGGFGTQVIVSNAFIPESDCEELQEELNACEVQNGNLQQELDDFEDMITPPVDDENPEGSGAWSYSVTSQYFGSVGPINNFHGPATMTSNLSIWWDGDAGNFKTKIVSSGIDTVSGGVWLTNINFRLRNQAGSITGLINAGATEGQTAYASISLSDGPYTVEAQRLSIRIYDGGGYSEGYATIGSFTVTGAVLDDNEYTSEIITDQDGNVIEDE